MRNGAGAEDVVELDLDFMQETFLLVWQEQARDLALTALARSRAPIAFALPSHVRGHRVGGTIASLYVSLCAAHTVGLQILYSLLPSLLNLSVKAAGAV